MSILPCNWCVYTQALSKVKFLFWGLWEKKISGLKLALHKNFASLPAKVWSGYPLFIDPRQGGSG